MHAFVSAVVVCCPAESTVTRTGHLTWQCLIVACLLNTVFATIRILAVHIPYTNDHDASLRTTMAMVAT